jgi:hypothetical protein
MKKFIISVLAVGSAITFFSTSVFGQLFQQQFSTTLASANNTTITTGTYCNSSPSNTQFNTLSSSGTGCSYSVPAGTQKLTFVRTGNAGSFSRTTDFSPTPSTLMYRLDLAVTGTTTGTTSIAAFQVGSAFVTANSTETNANTYARFVLNTTTTNGTFQIRDITNATNSGNLSGTQTILWVMNNSGATSFYRAPDGTNESIADDKVDIWAGTSKLFDDVSVQTTTQTITDLKFVFSNASCTIEIDNMLIDPIPTIPTANTAINITSNAFRARWSTVSGVTGYRVDVSAASDFSSFVPGYQNVYVSGASSDYLDVTGLNSSQTYYYRVRAASQYTVGEFASGNSSTVSLTTNAGSGPQEIDIESPVNSSIAINGTRASFGTYEWGTNNNFTFRVKNTGGSDLTLSSVAFGGANASEFTLVSPPSFPLTITAGDNYDFSVRFTPSGTGTRSATITFNNNDSDESVYLINISGTGIPNSASLIEFDNSFTTPQNILYKDYQENDLTSSSLSIMRFRIRDGGTLNNDADNLGTTLSAISLSLTNSSFIKRAALYWGSTEVAEVAVSGSTVSFTGLSGTGATASDDNNRLLELKVSFNTTVTDNAQFQFSFSSANVTAASGLSSFAAFGTVSSETSGNRIEVEATKLRFVQQPTNTNTNATMSPSPTVEAVDDNNLRDLDYNATISVTSSGTLNTTPMNATPVSGLATFGSTIHTAAGTGIVLSASSGSFSSVTSNSFIITTASTNTDYFRSRQIGNWTSASTWESSPTGLPGTWNNATLSPTQTANVVTVLHTVTINSSVTVDQVVVANGGVLTYAGSSSNNWYLNNGPGTDLIIENGGKLLITATNQGLFFVSGSGNPTMLVKSGGTVEAQSIGNGESDGYASDEWTYDGINTYDNLIQWENNSTFYWNVNGIFSTSGITYFYNTPNVSDIPVFKFNGSASNHGGSTATVIYGIMEVETGKTLTFANTGTKTITFGIRGAGNLTQASGCGQIIISGSGAVLGGGTLTLSTNGLNITSSTVVTLISNKVINAGPISLSGVFDLVDKEISGTYTQYAAAAATANTKTSHANGLRSSTGALQNNAATYNFSFTGSTVEYYRLGAQTITDNNYYNLILSGSGNKTLIGTTSAFGNLSWIDLLGTPVLKGGSYLLSVFGNWDNNSVNEFECETGTVFFGSTGNTRTISNANNFNILRVFGTVNVTAGIQNIYDRLELGNSCVLNSNGKFILKSSSTKTAYVDDFSSGIGSGSVINGNLTIERYVPLTVNVSATYPYQNRYHYMGALTGGTAIKWNGQFYFNTQGAINDGVTTVTPTTDCSLLFLQQGSAFSNLFTFNETKIQNDCFLWGWEPRTITASTPRGTGFAARINDASVMIAAGRVLSESGNYSNSAVTKNGLTISGGTGKNTISKGQHLVSNPFWAPIDWTKISTQTNLDLSAYRYNPATGNYEPVNNLSAPAKKIFSTNEAFVVMPLNNTLSSYSFTFSPDMRVNSNNNEFYRRQQPYLYAMNINVSANDESDNTMIAFDNSFTDAYDNGYDAIKLNSSLGVPSLYTRDAAQNRNSILAIAEATQQITIPLGVVIQYNGTHTLTFDGLNDFPSTSIIWLEDLLTGNIQYLRQNSIYTFTGNVNDNSDRFLIHFTPELLVSTINADCNNQGGIIELNQRGGVIWDYILTDDNNNVVNSNSFSNIESISNLPSGNYTLTLNNSISGYITVLNINLTGLTSVTASIVATQNQVMVNELFTLDAQTTGSTSNEWNMGDGTVYINQPSVTHSYSVPGVYNVILSASNDDCSAISSQSIQVDISTGIITAEDGKIQVYSSNGVIYINQTISKEPKIANLNIYNTLGQNITQANFNQPYNTVTIIPMDVAYGVYLAEIKFNNDIKIVKRIIIAENK